LSRPTPNPSLPGRGEGGAWPSVVAVVPARDEAEVIAESIASLAAQDYPGDFRIILVDDSSSDGTADIARAVGSDRLQIVTGAPLASGWTGKLWAVSQGIAAADDAPDYLLLTDADIAHAPDSVRSLVTRAVADDRVLVSLMARLRCESLAERALIPAFVWFFQMLYPFATVNRRGRGLGAAHYAALAAWAIMALLFQPMLQFYRRSPLWGPALPLIATFYAGCTLLSAWQHGRGRGGLWKGRVQADLSA
jgi:glycosyltransferase involved in cell wall biosynthesis